MENDNTQIVAVFDGTRLTGSTRQAIPTLVSIPGCEEIMDKEGLVRGTLDQLQNPNKKMSSNPLDRFAHKYGQDALAALRGDRPVDLAILMNSSGGDGVGMQRWMSAVDYADSTGGMTTGFVTVRAGSAGANVVCRAAESHCLRSTRWMWHPMHGLADRSNEAIGKKGRTDEDVEAQFKDQVEPLLLEMTAGHPEQGELKSRLETARTTKVPGSRTNDRVLRLTGVEADRFGISRVAHSGLELAETFTGHTGVEVPFDDNENPLTRFFARGIIVDWFHNEVNEAWPAHLKIGQLTRGGVTNVKIRPWSNLIPSDVNKAINLGMRVHRLGFGISNPELVKAEEGEDLEFRFVTKVKVRKEN